MSTPASVLAKPIMPFKPRLAIHVVWNADFTAGADFARYIFSRLCRDVEQPASRGLGIPTYFHSDATPAGAGLPGALDMDAADSTVAVFLLDTGIRSDQAWRDSVRQIEQQFAGQ